MRTVKRHTRSQSLTIEGRAVQLSNLEVKLYPKGFTKAELIEYYIRVAPFLLPHLRNRPVTLKRYPDSISGEAFWDKDIRFALEWVRTFPVPRRAGEGEIRYVVVDDIATLAWCA